VYFQLRAGFLQSGGLGLGNGGIKKKNGFESRPPGEFTEQTGGYSGAGKVETFKVGKRG
jgi:hypothetical protein